MTLHKNAGLFIFISNLTDLILNMKNTFDLLLPLLIADSFLFGKNSPYILVLLPPIILSCILVLCRFSYFDFPFEHS